MAQIVDTETVSDLVINKVPSQAVYDDMVAQGQIEENELYLVEGHGSGLWASFEIPGESSKTFSIPNGSKCAIFMIKMHSKDIYLLNSASNGTITIASVLNDSTITETHSTGSLTINNTTTATLFCYFVQFADVEFPS